MIELTGQEEKLDVTELLLDFQRVLTKVKQEKEAALREVMAARELLNVATVPKGFGFMATQKWRHDRYEWIQRNSALEQVSDANTR